MQCVQQAQWTSSVLVFSISVSLLLLLLSFLLTFFVLLFCLGRRRIAVLLLVVVHFESARLSGFA